MNVNCALLTKDEELISVFSVLEKGGAFKLCEVIEANVCFVDVDTYNIPEESSLPTVFISSNQENAIQAYEWEALDFILKPVTTYRVLKTINKIQDYLKKKKNSVGSLFVKNGGQHVNLLHDEILFIEALSDYSVIHSKNGKIIINSSLKKLESRLQGYNFMRVQRSYIANLNLVDSIDQNEICISGNRVPIGASFKKRIIDKIVRMRGVIG